MDIIKVSEIEKGAKILTNGGLMAFPTETVFGFGVIYDNEDAYNRLVSVKRRSPDKPFTMMLSNKEDASKYCELNDISRKLIDAFMPGQFTLITQGKSFLPKWCVGDTGLVGIRVPDYKNIQDLIGKTGKPLLVPSANRQGENPANNVQEIVNLFKGEIDAVLEGESTSKTPSTIVLVDGNNWKLIRSGLISEEQIKKVLED